jgi:hypothetical protein
LVAPFQIGLIPKVEPFKPSESKASDTLVVESLRNLSRCDLAEFCTEIRLSFLPLHLWHGAGT